MKRCTRCGKRKPLNAFRQYCDRRPEKWYAECKACRRARDYLRAEMSRRLIHQAIEAYGGYRCACCGVREPLFLTIDHINNGGSHHRRRVGTTRRFLQWLRKKGYPPGFQVLCSNCNHGRHRNGGVCPHEDPVGRTPAFMALGHVSTRHRSRGRATASSKSRT